MKRLALLLAVLAGLAALPAAAAQLPAALKGGSLVEGDVIRLSDIWDNLGEKADIPVASAPQPGKRITLDARWLAAAANAYGVDWRPASAFERLVIERAGQTVDVGTIEDEVREALIQEGAPANAAVEIANRANLRMVVPAGTPMIVGVREVAYDSRVNRFSAEIEVPANAPSATRMRLSGRVFSMTRLPVLSRIVNRGDVIGEGDVEWKDVREDAVRGEVASSFDQLVGLEPRHALRPGAPVRLTEVQRPVLVNRNGAVTMVVRTPLMQLTTQGRAIEEGSRGDSIRVTNLQTKKIVDAKVEGPGLVSVSTGAPRLLAN